MGMNLFPWKQTGISIFLNKKELQERVGKDPSFVNGIEQGPVERIPCKIIKK